MYIFSQVMCVSDHHYPGLCVGCSQELIPASFDSQASLHVAPNEAGIKVWERDYVGRLISYFVQPLTMQYKP